MILVMDGHGVYRQTLGADIVDSQGMVQRAVGSRSEVLRFLRLNQDTEFLLVAQGFAGRLADPDLASAVLCGVVKWDSRHGTLRNTPIPVFVGGSAAQAWTQAAVAIPQADW
jgi:hypothetical protein